MKTGHIHNPGTELQQGNDALWEWSVFWQSDQLQSCMPASGPGDFDYLQSAWYEFFGKLPTGARILDLGTGNGSVATRAIAVSQQQAKRFSVHGVDLADIDPSRFVASATSLLREVTFYPRTPMEKLPFTNDSFDAVTSQFALEYSRIDSSLAEAMRVLRDGGRFRFLLHADDGVLRRRCRMQRRQAEIILASPLFPCLTDTLEAIAIAERKGTRQSVGTAEREIMALKTVLDSLEHEFAGDQSRELVDNLLTAVRRVPGLRKSCALSTLLGMASEIKALLVAQAQRLNSMERVALDEATAKELPDKLRRLARTTVTLERAVAGAGGGSLGYWLFGGKCTG